MVRLLNSGLRAHGPRRYSPKPKLVAVPEGDLDSQLSWIAEPEKLKDRQQRANSVWDVRLDEDEPDETTLSGMLRRAVYDRVVKSETLQTPGASGDDSGEADTTDGQDVLEASGVPSDDPIDSEIKDAVIQPLPGSDLDEQLDKAAEPELETIPEGVTTIDALVDWVKAGDAPARAQIVLDQENTKPEEKRRKGLVSKLTDIILED